MIVVTRGYGSGGSIPRVATRGYTIGVAAGQAITSTEILHKPINAVLAGDQGTLRHAFNE
jgi:hypothetical protein